MYGELISLGLNAAGSIYGGIRNRKLMEGVRDDINAEKQRNEAWYNRRYNEDPIQRAAAEAVLTRLGEDVRDNNRRLAGAQAVMGGTDESVAAAKAAGGKVIADAASQIAAANEARRDRIEDQYRLKDSELAQRLRNMDFQQAQDQAKSVMELNKSMGNLSSMF